MDLGARFTILVDLLRGAPRMDVLYLLVDLGENYPPLPLVTHLPSHTDSFFCFLFSFLAYTEARHPSPSRHDHQEGRAAHLLPPFSYSGEPVITRPTRSSPPRAPPPPRPTSVNP